MLWVGFHSLFWKEVQRDNCQKEESYHLRIWFISEGRWRWDH